jgi:hypothetical protein
VRDLQTGSKKEGMYSHMHLKDRVVIISEKNMNNINALYGKCTTDELEQIVNNMIDNAVVEINEDRSRLHMDKMSSCSECEFMKMYDYGNRIYYCDHEDRTDEMGKLSEGDVPGICPDWCPLRCKIDNSSAAK